MQPKCTHGHKKRYYYYTCRLTGGCVRMEPTACQRAYWPPLPSAMEVNSLFSRGALPLRAALIFRILLLLLSRRAHMYPPPHTHVSSSSYTCVLILSILLLSRRAHAHQERVYLLVLSLAASTPQWIHQPKPRDLTDALR
jgi:hypothetical protein